ncbi:MAG TPA: DUF4388 domain-containing protein [Thermoanaerobaculia bacterium]|nr:DUF4388 domain-containing protein [Thermoanaerobaculia bacterium]
MEFSGRLASVSLADLLQWSANDQRTGCLVVRTSSREKRVYFSRGDVVACLSADPAEYLGQFLLLGGYLKEPQLVRALTYCRQHRERLGRALVELRLLSKWAVKAALRRHIEDRVCDLFLWRRGVFYFENSMPAEEDLLPEPIHTVALAMEGSRWVDEHDRIREIFIHDGVVLRRGAQWGRAADGPLQERILALFEDSLTLATLYERVRGSRFRFLSAAYELTVGEVLDIESVPDEGSPGTSTEIRLFDLLLEQAAEEDVLFSPRHLSLPLEVMDRFYPVWVRGDEDEPAGKGEEVPISGEELAFYRQLDGSRSLRELVVEDRDRRHWKMDLLLLQLQLGRLALLPRPLSELEAATPAAARSPWLRRLFAPRSW